MMLLDFVTFSFNSIMLNNSQNLSFTPCSFGDLHVPWSNVDGPEIFIEHNKGFWEEVNNLFKM